MSQDGRKEDRKMRTGRPDMERENKSNEKYLNNYKKTKQASTVYKILFPLNNLHI